MNKKDEALKMALDAMQTVTDVFLDTEGNYGTLEHDAIAAVYKSIDAIREVLAELEQEGAKSKNEHVAVFAAKVAAVRAVTAEVDNNIDCAEVTRCFKEAVLTPKHTRNKKEQA